jgi:hypothetical protein
MLRKVTSIQVLAGTYSVLERQGTLISGTPLSCVESMGIFEKNCVKDKIRVEIWPRSGLQVRASTNLGLWACRDPTPTSAVTVRWMTFMAP